MTTIPLSLMNILRLTQNARAIKDGETGSLSLWPGTASSSSLGFVALGPPHTSRHFIIHSQNDRCGHEALGSSISCRGSLADFCGASAVCWRYGVVSISSIPGVFVGEPNAPAFDAEPSPAAAAVLLVITSSSGVSLRSFVTALCLPVCTHYYATCWSL